MSEVNLYNLSLDQLKEQARILGIVIKGNPSAETLRTRIKAAVEIEPPSNQKVKKEEDPGRKKDWITVVIDQDEKDQAPVFVGVNGKSYYIRRGEPVPVPPPVVEVLTNAKQVIMNQDGSSRIVPTYPFRIEK